MKTLLDASFGDNFLVQELDEQGMKLDFLRHIGIKEGNEIQIVDTGYLDNTLLVSVGEYTVQLNKTLLARIKGEIIKTKKLVK